MSGTSKPRVGRRIGFRKRVPDHLLKVARNFTANFHFPAGYGERAWDREIKPKTEIKCSLGTSHPRLYEERLLLARKQYNELIARMEGRSPPLLDYQISFFADSVYEFLLTKLDMHPGQVTNPKVFLAFATRTWKALAIHKDSFALEIESYRGVLPYVDCKTYSEFLDRTVAFLSNEMIPARDITAASNLEFSNDAINFRVGAIVRWWLELNKVVVATNDVRAIMKKLDGILIAKQQVAVAPPSHLAPLGNLLDANETPAPIVGKTIVDVFEKWQSERLYRHNTSRAWSPIMKKLDVYLRHKDVSEITRSDMIGWKDKLIVEDKLTPKTVRFTYLKSAAAILSFAQRNEYIKIHPLEKSILELAASTKPDKEPYKDSEVAVILRAAKEFNHDHRFRWLSWILASTGARASEIAQLRSSDIVQEDGIWVFHLRSGQDGETVKNKRSSRVCPLHNQLIADGFLVFVATKEGLPLFYRPKPIALDKKHPSASVASTHGEWIRSLEKFGIDFTDKGPNHAFRHWFTTKQLELGVQEGITARIQGHAIKGERNTYVGRRMISSMQEAVNKIYFSVL